MEPVTSLVGDGGENHMSHAFRYVIGCVGNHTQQGTVCHHLTGADYSPHGSDSPFVGGKCIQYTGPGTSSTAGRKIVHCKAPGRTTPLTDVRESPLID